MSLDPGEVYKVMRCAYRHGVLQKFTVIQGEALAEVIRLSGCNLGDLLNLVDGAGEATVNRIETLLRRLGPVVRYAGSDRAMSLFSRALDLGPVRRMAVAYLRNAILQVVTGREAPSLRRRVRALAGGRAA